jgi:hypothetical protein
LNLLEEIRAKRDAGITRAVYRRERARRLVDDVAEGAGLKRLGERWREIDAGRARQVLTMS